MREKKLKIKYIYKDKEFNDIRDIVHNNKNLEIDYRYILEEYIPYPEVLSDTYILELVMVAPLILFNRIATPIPLSYVNVHPSIDTPLALHRNISVDRY